MSRSKHTAWVCGIVVALMVLVTVLFTFGESLGIEAVKADMPYVDSLFDTGKVHTLDIVVSESDWQGMLDNASQKEYIAANVVIDGQSVKNVGIRPKGNSSLSTLVMSDSDRYSFKIEFDHYQTGQTYLGLDKLALNNITSDNTYLKDYLAYQMMVAFDAESPLSSFIYITVNGEDWGLYLAVEGIEESFAQRTYGSDYGQIYKPDNMDMGGGRDRDMGDFEMPDMSAFLDENGEMPDFAQMFEGGEMPDFSQMFGGGGMPGMGQEEAADGEAGAQNAARNFGGGGGGGGFGGFGASDVSLQYIDDDLDSYPNIFEEAVFKASDADKTRLVAALKQLDSGEDLETAVNTEEVLRYFVVHNYLLNFDSYTGSMVHNYYLHEKDGIMSMIAWDYNLSFGGFAMGGTGSDGTSLANYPIDTPVSGGTLEDRPMIGRLLADETYMARYHELFDEFLQVFFRDGKFIELFDSAVELISPYVEKDPTKFTTYEQYLAAVENLREFCLLRAESIEGQLDGTIPATTEGQAADSSALVDASSVDMNAINSSGFGGFGGGGERGGGMQREWGGGNGGGEPADAAATEAGQGRAMPAGMSVDAMPENMPAQGEMPEWPGGEMPQRASGEMPAGMPDMSAMGGAPPSDTAEQTPQQTQEAAAAEPTEVATADAAAGEEVTVEVRDRRGGMQMGGFGMMSGGQQTEQDTSLQYWLLGGSVVLLIAGLCFAFFFRRPK